MGLLGVCDTWNTQHSCLQFLPCVTCICVSGIEDRLLRVRFHACYMITMRDCCSQKDLIVFLAFSGMLYVISTAQETCIKQGHN
jgi:hypothetical protein